MNHTNEKMHLDFFKPEIFKAIANNNNTDVVRLLKVPNINFWEIKDESNYTGITLNNYSILILS